MIYEILTWLIIQLSKIRKKIVPYQDDVIRKDRDEIGKLKDAQDHLKGYGFLLICCDCGLSHRIYNWKGTKDLHCIPLRPRNYKYRLR